MLLGRFDKPPRNDIKMSNYLSFSIQHEDQQDKLNLLVSKHSTLLNILFQFRFPMEIYLGSSSLRIYVIRDDPGMGFLNIELFHQTICLVDSKNNFFLPNIPSTEIINTLFLLSDSFYIKERKENMNKPIYGARQ